MNIAIVGAGMIGGTLGRLWLSAGHRITFGTRHPERVIIPGANSVGIREAVDWGTVAVLSIPLSGCADVAAAAGTAIGNKVLLDTCNPIEHRDAEAVHEIAEAAEGSGVWVARHFPSARVVKAFNTVHFKTLQSSARQPGVAPGIPLAGDDVMALVAAEGLVRDAGFEPVVVGRLREASRFDPGTTVWNRALTPPQLRAALALA